jgi:hypothetical protein
VSESAETAIDLGNVFDANLGFELHLALLAAVLVGAWLLRRREERQGSKVQALLRFGLVVAAIVVGWMAGTDLGLIAGLVWDEATANDFVSNAMLTIPLGGLIGPVLMGWLAIRLIRPRTAAEPAG